MTEELALTVTEQEQEPALVRVGERSISRNGFSTQACMEHLGEPDEEGSRCEPKCLARVLWGQATKANQKQASKRICNLRTTLAERARRLLVVAYGHKYSRITAFFLMPRVPSTDDLQTAQVMMDRLKHSKDLSIERKQLLLDLFNEALATPEEEP